MSHAFAKTDGNHKQIVNELRQCGMDVDDVSSLKKLYDIIVSGVALWSNGHAVAVRVEIKRNEQAKLTDDEAVYWQNQHHVDNLIKATCADDVLRWFGVMN